MLRSANSDSGSWVVTESSCLTGLLQVIPAFWNYHLPTCVCFHPFLPIFLVLFPSIIFAFPFVILFVLALFIISAPIFLVLFPSIIFSLPSVSLFT